MTPCLFVPPVAELCSVINWDQFTSGCLQSDEQWWWWRGSPADPLPVCPRKLFPRKVSALFHQLLIASLLNDALPPRGVSSLLRGLFHNVSLPVLWKKNKKTRWCTITCADVQLKPWLPAAGTDEDAVLMLLTSRSNDQRQQIKAAYKKAYGKVRRTSGTESRWQPAVKLMDGGRVTSAAAVHPFSFIAFILMVLAVEYIIVTVVECQQKVRTSVWVLLASSLCNDAEEFYIETLQYLLQQSFLNAMFIFGIWLYRAPQQFQTSSQFYWYDFDTQAHLKSAKPWRCRMKVFFLFLDVVLTSNLDVHKTGNFRRNSIIFWSFSWLNNFLVQKGFGFLMLLNERPTSNILAAQLASVSQSRTRCHLLWTRLMSSVITLQSEHRRLCRCLIAHVMKPPKRVAVPSVIKHPWVGWQRNWEGTRAHSNGPVVPADQNASGFVIQSSFYALLPSTVLSPRRRVILRPPVDWKPVNLLSACYWGNIRHAISVRHK